ncbi:MAG: prephenate dehydratase [Planctomycetaceae bacterium]|nr:prephenate dehydratase [Planctomycetaceae bacterium]
MAKKSSARKQVSKQGSPSRAASGAGARAKKPSAAKATPAAAKSTAKTPSSRNASPEVQIRRLDKDIVELVNRRSAMTLKLLQQEAVPKEALFDPHADDELWEKLKELNKGPMPDSTLRAIFREILSATKQQVKRQRVAYLGPLYSFTHFAALERFGSHADLVAVNTIASVFEEVNRGHTEFGIVPIENSTDGRVVDTLDMFQRLPLKICGELQIAVHHNLLSRSPRSEINEVYSKPQALSQCRDWLSRNMPQADLIEVTSTSTAAQLARDKPGAGAVASRQAAVQYDLEIVADNIEDNPNNVTRFAVIGDVETKPSGHDRTSILLQIPHAPGALSDALNAFKVNRVNLTWIESFPLRGPESGYLFFLDFEGHEKDAKIKKTLAALQKKAVALRILGSYPRSEPLDG